MNKKYLIITAPSGGGKGTVINLSTGPKYGHNFLFSVSCTTRSKGKDEKQGETYDYVSIQEFEKRIKENYFIEYEFVSGNYYGTPRAQFEQAQNTNKILLFDVDVKGAKKLKELLGDDAMVVFIDSGDNTNVYKQRIISRNRSSDDAKSIEKRVARIEEEIAIGREICDVSLGNNKDKEAFIRLVEDALFDRLLRLLPNKIPMGS